MFNEKTTRYISPNECPYSVAGENLADMRRAKLARVAQSLGVFHVEHSKNDMLHAVIAKLRKDEAPEELLDEVLDDGWDAPPVAAKKEAVEDDE